MILFIVGTMMFFIVYGAQNAIGLVGYLQAFGFATLCTVILIALCCIPVLIYCYFKKVIPDIDYSVNTAFALTIIGIISEVLF